jgi:diadenylate cyclase
MKDFLEKILLSYSNFDQSISINDPIFQDAKTYIAIKLIIDVALVSYLLYKIYKLAKGTAAIKIFFGLSAILIIHLIVSEIGLKYISQLIGGFVAAGFIVIVILFQQEIRKYLSQIGKGKVIKNQKLLKFFNTENDKNLNIDAIIKSCITFQKSKTGAIIVLTLTDDLNYITESAVQIDSEITFPLLESIFYKNSPLHDGAVVIRNNRIVAARCILPVSNDDDFPGELGMRHRAAVGISEHSDAITLIVSEQNGKISSTLNGNIKIDLSEKQLKNYLIEKLNNTREN